jgi:hypothetical protein
MGYGTRLIVVAAFGAGYLVSDLVDVVGGGVQPAFAEVFSMDYRSLSEDKDFRKAVLRVVGDNCYVLIGNEDVYC